ncbi:solute carrier family 25 member 36 [Hydra vulgaris]|uniref:Solute carrier family 25 member 36 n=1 Tax=Hydra vulgaris TaxID=6087 RepID=A0ABM4D0P5_HYDVU
MMLSSTTTATKAAMNAKQQPVIVSNKHHKKSVFVNFIAGGVGGTAGVFVTCPLDVIQTRLQSSIILKPSSIANGVSVKQPLAGRYGSKVFLYMLHIVKTEGFFALYRGIVPNLIGIAPSRATYFAVYTKTKSVLNNTQLSNSSWTHMFSALSASLSVSTLTNPIWFMKTKLQLDTSVKRRSVFEIAKEVFRNDGIRGFYRGLSASYYGASETMIYFVLYEKIKSILNEKNSLSAVDVITASFFAKTIAAISVYPHEVVRTRLRQESSAFSGNRNYSGFFQTLFKVFREERWAGLYGGMGAHLMRQVPNTVIMFATYEAVVNLLS